MAPDREFDMSKLAREEACERVRSIASREILSLKSLAIQSISNLSSAAQHIARLNSAASASIARIASAVKSGRPAAKSSG